MSQQANGVSAGLPPSPSSKIDLEQTEEVSASERGASPSTSALGKRKNPAHGRKNASRACDACFARRTRCDQGAPKCSQCQTGNLRCEYTRPVNKRGRPGTVAQAFRENDGGSAASLGNRDYETRPSSTVLSPGASASMQDLLPALASSNNNNSSDASPSMATNRSIPLSSTDIDTTLATLPQLGLENAVSLNVINELVEHFATNLWPQLPIVHMPSFRSALRQRQDKTSPLFYMLVLNICAATCMACRSLPPSPAIAATNYSWEELGRHSNAQIRQRRDRIHTMARAGSISCLQNVILVAYFEKSIGSPASERLFSEAERIAQSFHLGMEVPDLNAIEAELRRRVYWLLYTNDKMRALLYRQTMSMRRDEASLQLPMLLADELPEVGLLGSSLSAFIGSIELCLASETILLRWRQDLAPSYNIHNREELINQHFYQSLNDLLHLPVTRDGTTLNHDMHSSVLILKGAMTVEVYHRYLSLMDVERTALSIGLANAAIKMAQDISRRSRNALRLLLPSIFGLLEMTQRKLELIVEYLRDPLTRHEASTHVTLLKDLIVSCRYGGSTTFPSANVSRAGTPCKASDVALSIGVIRAEASQTLGLEDLFDPALLTAEPGLGTLDFLSDLSTCNFQIPDWAFEIPGSPAKDYD